MPFIKGQTGNPKGRPPRTGIEVELNALARTYTTRAIERLVYWMESNNPKASVTACSILLDRAHGRPAQQLAIDTALRECRIDSEPLTEAEWVAIYGSKANN